MIIGKTKKITKIKKNFIRTKIICNRCGKEEKVTDYFSDIQSQKFDFGYGSSYDGDTWEFELCDNCAKEIIKNWKYQPLIKENI